MHFLKGISLKKSASLSSQQMNWNFVAVRIYLQSLADKAAAAASRSDFYPHKKLIMLSKSGFNAPKINFHYVHHCAG